MHFIVHEINAKSARAKYMCTTSESFLGPKLIIRPADDDGRPMCGGLIMVLCSALLHQYVFFIIYMLYKYNKTLIKRKFLYYCPLYTVEMSGCRISMPDTYK